MVPALLDLFSSDRHYYPNNNRNDRSEAYAFGVILFKCLFGFEPFTDKRVDTLKLSGYLDFLNEKTPEGCTKIVYFLKVKTNLSPEATDLLENLLSMSKQFTMDNFIQHPWLKLSKTEFQRDMFVSN